MDRAVRLKKITFALPESLIQELRRAAQKKRVPSANAAVREALERYLADLKKEDFRREMEAAAKDPLFLEDIKTTESAFQKADTEAVRMIPEW